MKLMRQETRQEIRFPVPKMDQKEGVAPVTFEVKHTIFLYLRAIVPTLPRVVKSVVNNSFNYAREWRKPFAIVNQWVVYSHFGYDHDWLCRRGIRE